MHRQDSSTINHYTAPKLMTIYQSSFPMMGTIITLKLYHPHGEQLIRDVYLLLKDYEKRFSANNDASELMKINIYAGVKPVSVSHDLFQLIKRAKTESLTPNQPFNIAIGPLVKLWSIGFKQANYPNSDDIQTRLNLINANDIILDEQHSSVFLNQSSMEIDLGAIAKGYFADQIKAYLLQHDVKHGIIDLGGNVLTIGNAPERENGYWAIGLQNPNKTRGNFIRTVLVSDLSVVTSGIYERFHQTENKQYHHIFDPSTGYPIDSDIVSITIISQSSIDGEIWTTKAFQSSAKNCIDLLNQQRQIDGIVITKNHQIYTTNRLSEIDNNIYRNDCL